MRLRYSQRPPNFKLNPNSQLARSLVFAGLGRFPGTTRYHDSSLYGNTGTLTGVALTGTTSNWVPTLGRIAFDFDGTNDYAELPLSTILKPAGAMTLCGWFQGTCGTNGSGFGCQGGTNLRGYTLGLLGSAGRYARFSIAAAINTIYTVQSTNTTATNLIHFAGVFVPSVGCFLYINGQLHASNTTSPPASQYIANGISVKIGNRGDLSADSWWDGIQADQLIYERALSVTEISALADPSNVMLAVGGNPLLIEEAGPVGVKTYFTWQGWDVEPPVLSTGRRNLILGGEVI